MVTVVGMVADERHNGVTGIGEGEVLHPAQPVAHRHAGQPDARRRSWWSARRATRWRVAGPVRNEIRAMDANVPVANIRPMTEVVATALATPRLTGFLMGMFAAIALTLAAVGIYGVLSYLVARRTQEIGIRLAIGADRTQVLAMVLRQGLTLAGGGIAVGVGAAFLLTRLMQSLLYQVRPGDPVDVRDRFARAGGGGASRERVPAFRATRVSPLMALRTEKTVVHGQRIHGAAPAHPRCAPGEAGRWSRRVIGERPEVTCIIREIRDRG